MVLHFNVTKEERKLMVKAIEEATGLKAKYKGMPSAAYEIGDWTVGKNGELEFPNATERDQITAIVEACTSATGVRAEDWEDTETQPEETEVTISIPKDKVGIENLKALLNAKGNLIKKALGIETVEFTTDDEKVSFPWFTGASAEEINAYTKFIAAICEMSITQKRVTAKVKENENEKYAFRCFLLRLGFIGDEYKADRKILISKLEGSSAFKAGAKKGGEEA